VTSSRRERQLAREKYERQQERRTRQAAKRQRNQRIVAVAVVIALVGGGAAWAVVSATSTPPATPSALASALASNMPSADPIAADDAPSTDEPIDEEACSTPGTVRADDVRYPEPGAVSDASLVAEPSWLSFQTNCGDIVIRTDPKAPKTIASMAFLAESGYFDGTACHRVTTEGIYVLQCGDPRGNGSGGPGYEIPDENLPAEGTANYPAGTVAMANAGPGTGGSQFFVVYKDTTLPSGYTIWGQVESGLDIVERIANAGVADGGNDGRPAQPVVIDRATISPIPS
jgi:peptidyl-prolyl cis-trans isomerase B (cyclophilin B)